MNKLLNNSMFFPANFRIFLIILINPLNFARNLTQSMRANLGFFLVFGALNFVLVHSKFSLIGFAPFWLLAP